MNDNPRAPEPPRAVVRAFPRAGAIPSNQAPPEVRDIVELLSEACGRDLVAVVFFGSRLLGTSPGDQSAADLFVVVENYLRFYEAIGSRLPAARHSGIMAALNRVLTPNIIYLNDPGGMRAGAKCFVVTEYDLGHELSSDAKDHFFRGRLAQRVDIVFARSDKDRIALERRLETARRLTVEWVPLYIDEPSFGVLDFCRRMMEVSYAAEIRPEARSRVHEVVQAQASFFRLAYGRVLQDAVRDGRLVAEGERYSVAKKASWRERRKWYDFFRRSKARATMRWFKYMLTFDDWLDYIVRKIERRSGIRIELSKSERRFPILFLWPKAVRVIRAMRTVEASRTGGTGAGAVVERSDA
ncbi:MAG TPA: hypothetical protein VFU38_07940 [Candidatus Krumholzibacteria bacterium]|nr:hypothetical protein [Candidatus Krumholzibacteria bacterium]